MVRSAAKKAPAKKPGRVVDMAAAGEYHTKDSGVPNGFEVGTVEKFDIRVVKDSVRAQLMAKLLNLKVGEGFVVAGVERDRVTSSFPQIKKDTGARFRTHRLAPMRYRVVRVE